MCLALVGEDELLVERADWRENLITIIIIIIIIVTTITIINILIIVSGIIIIISRMGMTFGFTIPHLASHPSQLPWLALDSWRI